MPNKKTTMLDLLVTQVGNLSTVAKATRILAAPADARKNSPYAGLISGTEEVIVEDATDLRYELDVDLIMLKRGRDIELMLDSIKNLLFADALATAIGALQVRITRQEEVALIDSDAYSSMRIAMTITYTVGKDSF